MPSRYFKFRYSRQIFLSILLLATLACAAPALTTPTLIPTFDVNQLPTLVAQTAQALALSATATPTVPPSETPTATFTLTLTFTATETPSATLAPFSTGAVTLTGEASPTSTAQAFVTLSVVTATPQPAWTATKVPVATATPTKANTATPQPAWTATKVPAATQPPTATNTPAPTLTPSLTATITLTPTSTPTATAEVCPQTNTSFEAKALELINAERAKAGLPALAYSSQLTAAAQLHSADMACNNYFSHTGLDGSSVADRVSQQGYVWSYVGENIAAGYSTPKDAVNGWMNSPGHKANILSPNYTEIGLGYAYGRASAYGMYWTAVFAKP
ncbi:MAG: hypothetical protein Fur002_12970 [Anaerolineales bacterium]